MEIKNKFVCVSDGDGVTIKQEIDKTMDLMESLSELEKLKTEVIQIENQVKQIEEAIASKKMEKDLEQSKTNLNQVKGLETQWIEAIKEKRTELVDKMKVKVKLEKTKARYNSNMKMQEKLASMSQILGPIANEFHLEMKSEIVQELRRDFDSI
jgi:hypothetical protein